MELSPPRCAVEDDVPPFAKSALLVRSTIFHNTRTRAGFWIVIAALLGSALKAVVAWNTIGTNDVITFYQFAASLQNHGLEWTYAHDIAFNHPPLTAYFLIGIYKLSHLPVFHENAISFPFLLRLPGIIADIITVWVVVRLARLTQHNIPAWTLVVFALSPVSLMITGFHGNTDPIMVMFLTVAALAAVSDKPILCGLFWALSCQIKIAPFLILPILFFYWMHRRAAFKFVSPMALTFLAFWSQPLFNFPLVFAKNVLSYGSFWGLWGVTYWLRQTGWAEFARVTYHNFTPAENVVGAVLKMLIVVAVLLIAWRRRCLGNRDLLLSIAYAWVVFFIFSPGVCAQYLVWLAPFVLFLSPVFFVWFTATSSLFLFFFYNSIADKFPWYLGISHGGHLGEWGPWSVWPWGTLIAGLVVFWCNAKRRDPSLKLISLSPVSAA